MNNKGSIIVFTIIVFIIEAVLISLLFTLYYRRISSFRNRTNEIYKELDVDLYKQFLEKKEINKLLYKRFISSYFWKRKACL